MAKVSGAMKDLIKKIIFIKNQNYEPEVERQIFEHLRVTHSVNYFEAMSKSMKAPWSRLLSTEPPSKKVPPETFWKYKRVY